MYVGGEFYYDGKWSIATPTLSTGGGYFLAGGKACLIVISDFFRQMGIQKILLPAYLCPEILDTFLSRGMEWDFYPIRPDLSIDLATLAQMMSRHTAVYFINYFGFRHDDNTRSFLADLSRNGIPVVEDNAQAGFPQQTTGNFVFNSLRKLVPYDGGYLRSNEDLRERIAAYPHLQNRRLPLIHRYRSGLSEYVYRGIGDPGDLAALYESAESCYRKDAVVAGDPKERWQIEHLDWEEIRRVRRENYCYLLERLTAVPEVTPIFPALQEGIMPLGMPVYVNGAIRNDLFDMLGREGVGLTIHWDSLLTDPRTNHDPVTLEMAARMLTLVCDQRASHKQLDFQIDRLQSAIQRLSHRG